VNQKNAGRCCFVSDDLHADDIHEKGHLNHLLGKAVRLGLDPITAIQLVTLNPAAYFSLKDRGAIAPGYRADIVVLDDLDRFKVDTVYKDGRMVAREGALVVFPEREDTVELKHQGPLNIPSLQIDDFRIPHPGGEARIIEIIPGQILTRMRRERVPLSDGFVCSSTDSDILKLCVVERHKGTGNIGLGLVRGFGLKKGALASSVAHDSHNVIVVGVNDREILAAVKAVKTMGGGLAVARGNEILAKTPLEIGGLMSNKPLETLVRQLKAAKKAASTLGCTLEEPFMALSFLALPVIPELKLTDKGLVDVNRFKIVSLFD
jgi:adenine deaminase